MAFALQLRHPVAWLMAVTLLVAGCDAQQAALTGSSWRVVEVWYEAQNGLQPVTGRAPTVAFGADGRISGTGGCNSFSGTYRAGGDTLATSGMASTEMYCYPPGAPTSGQSAAMVQETAFLAALRSAGRYGFDGSRLQLRAADRVVVVLERS